MYNNDWMDFFIEVNHGPFLIDNNILLSDVSIGTMSEGGAFVHNLILGKVDLSIDNWILGLIIYIIQLKWRDWQ